MWIYSLRSRLYGFVRFFSHAFLYKNFHPLECLYGAREYVLSSEHPVWSMKCVPKEFCTFLFELHQQNWKFGQQPKVYKICIYVRFCDFLSGFVPSCSHALLYRNSHPLEHLYDSLHYVLLFEHPILSAK